MKTKFRSLYPSRSIKKFSTSSALIPIVFNFKDIIASDLLSTILASTGGPNKRNLQKTIIFERKLAYESSANGDAGTKNSYQKLRQFVAKWENISCLNSDQANKVSNISKGPKLKIYNKQ